MNTTLAEASLHVESVKEKLSRVADRLYKVQRGLSEEDKFNSDLHDVLRLSLTGRFGGHSVSLARTNRRRYRVDAIMTSRHDIAMFIFNLEEFILEIGSSIETMRDDVQNMIDHKDEDLTLIMQAFIHVTELLQHKFTNPIL